VIQHVVLAKHALKVTNTFVRKVFRR
jgi:hypothetical protein